MNTVNVLQKDLINYTPTLFLFLCLSVCLSFCAIVSLFSLFLFCTSNVFIPFLLKGNRTFQVGYSRIKHLPALLPLEPVIDGISDHASWNEISITGTPNSHVVILK